MQTFANKHKTQSTAKADGNVLGFAGIWLKPKHWAKCLTDENVKLCLSLYAHLMPFE